MDLKIFQERKSLWSISRTVYLFTKLKMYLIKIYLNIIEYIYLYANGFIGQLDSKFQDSSSIIKCSKKYNTQVTLKNVYYFLIAKVKMYFQTKIFLQGCMVNFSTLALIPVIFSSDPGLSSLSAKLTNYKTPYVTPQSLCPTDFLNYQAYEQLLQLRVNLSI